MQGAFADHNLKNPPSKFPPRNNFEDAQGSLPPAATLKPTRASCLFTNTRPHATTQVGHACRAAPSHRERGSSLPSSLNRRPACHFQNPMKKLAGKPSTFGPQYEHRNLHHSTSKFCTHNGSPSAGGAGRAAPSRRKRGSTLCHHL